MDSEAPSLAAVLGTFAVDAGLAWMIGSVALGAWARGRSGTWAGAMRERHAHGLLPAGAATLLALAFDLWWRSAEAAGVPLLAAGRATMTMLTATHYGRAWLFGVAGVVFIVSATTARRSVVERTTFTTVAAIVGLGVLVYTRSIVSHAGGDGDLSFAVAIDSVHLAMVSLWAGVVWVSALAIRSSTDDDAALSWLRTLSTIATIALAAILLSGLVNTWRASAGSLSALWGSIYGITLASKVALVLLAAALGGINRWVYLPRLLACGIPRRPAARRAFLTVMRFEAVVLAIVLMLAATLGNLEPPASM